jgi:hypothetical protein
VLYAEGGYAGVQPALAATTLARSYAGWTGAGVGSSVVAVLVTIVLVVLFGSHARKSRLQLSGAIVSGADRRPSSQRIKQPKTQTMAAR